jgi:GNAT superfamily N-acetyltransferase
MFMELSPDFKLRMATGDDAPTLSVLVHGAYRGDSSRRGWTHEADLLDGQRIDEEGLAAILADGDHRILLAFDGDAMIGCVEITRVAADRAYLGMLTVDPLRQTGGIGRVLIDAAERAAAELFGATTMEMTVVRQRVELIAYYVRRGYRETGESRPFPYDDLRFGLPKVADLEFTVLLKTLG